jgi:hypothetical protein
LAGADERGEAAGGPVAARVEVEQLPGLGVGGEPDPVGVPGELAGQVRGDGAVPGQLGRVVREAEQGGQVDADLQLRPPRTAGPARLAGPARVTLPVGRVPAGRVPAGGGVGAQDGVDEGVGA